MSDTNTQQETYEYKAEMKQLLHLIVHSLYTHKEVFLRELISNASDALNKVRIMKLTDADIIDADGPMHIKIELDTDNRTFTIEDTGVGMTREDLVNKLGTVASSGTLEFLKASQADKKEVGADLIGKFGVGFYSAFMVTEEITVETRHASKDSAGLRWTSKGEGTYQIEEIEKEHRGTRITFTLKEEDADYADDVRVKHVIQRYSNFVNFP
ncbi:MAG: molecular chaperone HtpG, partial [Ectothiorhodospiraceae bacterium]|nr:molecular chaperone HtpG [Ectothiorhodospiraceae bacterium]